MDKYYQDRINKMHDFRQAIKLGQCCQKCGESNISLLEFAHYDRKNKNVSIRDFRSIEVLKNELSKGRFLCIWCHRLETREEINRNMKNKSYEYTIEEINMSKGISEVKKCNGPMCNGEKRHKSLFYSSGKYLKSQCKKCVLYKDNLKRIRAREHVANVKLDIKVCEICNISVTRDTVCCFDFDHIDRNTKFKEISKLVKDGYPIEKIDYEISKCRMLCCKCHRLHTIKQMGHIDYSIIRPNNIELYKSIQTTKPKVTLNIIKPKVKLKIVSL